MPEHNRYDNKRELIRRLPGPEENSNMSPSTREPTQPVQTPAIADITQPRKSGAVMKPCCPKQNLQDLRLGDFYAPLDDYIPRPDPTTNRKRGKTTIVEAITNNPLSVLTV